MITSSTTLATRTMTQQPTKRPTLTTTTSTSRVFFVNWMSRAVGTAALEDRRFHELFRASIGVVLHVWNAMEEGGLLPKESRPKHLLWTLYFLKVYPREAAGCSAVGGGGGAIDPKTLRQWVWLMIERIGELADDVVSIYFFYFASR